MPVITSHRWKESPAFATPSHTKLSLLRVANIAFLLLLSAFGNGDVAFATTSVSEEVAPKNKKDPMVSPFRERKLCYFWAVSRLIECLSLSRIPLTIKQQVQHLDSLDANLNHPMEDIQRAAGAALAAFTKSYFPVGTNGPSDRLQKRVVDKYIEAIHSEDNPAATRGFAIGMGVLPAKLLAPNHTVLDSVIKCLSDAANYRSLVGGQGDAETRRNAIESLISICETVGIGFTSKETDYPVVSLNEEQVKKIFNVLLEGLKDYNADRRGGDVGPWSRIAAMKGLETLTYLAVFNKYTSTNSIKQCQQSKANFENDTFIPKSAVIF